MAHQQDFEGMAESADYEDVNAPHIRIYEDRSALYDENQKRLQVFGEGPPKADARNRALVIRQKLREGFVRALIQRCKDGTVTFEALTKEQRSLIERLEQAVTSEFGRAVIGLAILQMAIKAIDQNQNVRLHKAGRVAFSWAEGIPMRVIDEQFITPVLREEGLLLVNRFGVMMTRTLAENYPYTKFYKAAVRGAKRDWLELVDLLEAGRISAEPALEYMISLMIRTSDQFQRIASEVVELAKTRSSSVKKPEDVLKLIVQHMTYPRVTAARLLEIAMHSLMQVMEEKGALGELELRPISQMRQANKKAGNIADIEVLSSGIIVEAWDAKFGKPYLYDELLELSDKLSQEQWPALEVAGFVVDTQPDLRDDVRSQCDELECQFGIKVPILSLDDWLSREVSLIQQNERAELAKAWLVAYAESLALRRREKAPIDEPTETWLVYLKDLLTKKND